MNARDVERELKNLRAAIDAIERDLPVPLSRDPLPGDAEVVGRGLVVPNDQVSPALTGDSDYVAVRRLSDPDPLDGTQIAGSAEALRCWWPKTNDDYATVRYSAALATGGTVSRSASISVVLLVAVDGDTFAYAAEGGGASGRLVRVTDVSKSDYLAAREIVGGVEQSSTIYIAKPWFLRGPDTWHGKQRKNISYSYATGEVQKRTATRSVSGVSTSRTQSLVPAYVVNDRLSVVSAATGVSRSFGGNDFPVTLLDVNVDARMWSET